MKLFPALPLLFLLVGCTQVPQWDTPERQAAEAELDHAAAQLEMNGGAGELALIAEKQVAADFTRIPPK